ncbi:MAG: alpha/beta fold hydrolase [bacterium]|nr:alpha/beta fold hydrolase [bacterium]
MFVVDQKIPSFNQSRIVVWRLRLFLILVIVCLLGVSAMLFVRPPNAVIIRNEEEQTVTPTPHPFAELTIPYLRTRSYDSVLSPLDLYSGYGSYTAYLTSYASDGLRVNALLTKPSGEMPEKGWPAIIFIHGYIAPTTYATTEKYNDYVDYLARNGLVVFKIDLRGHGDSEGEAGGGYYGSDYIVDTLSAYAALQSSGFVNPEKIGIWGHSMAGNIIMRSLAAKPEIPAAVIWAGAVYTYTDQQKYGINDQSYRPPGTSTVRLNRRRELFEKVGSPSATSVFWQQVAPTNYLNDLKGAIQFNHAVDDDVVNIGYSRDLNDLLNNTSVPHELHEYPSGGHNISGSSFVQAMDNTVRFFKKYLE